MEERRRIREKQGRRRLLIALAGAGAVVWLGRRVLAALAVQLAGGYAVMALALPLCRRLERRLSPGASAALALGLVGAGAVGVTMLIVPPLVQQLRQVTASFPGLVKWAEGLLARAQAFLSSRGFNVEPLQDQLMETLSRQAGTLAVSLASLAGRLAQVMSKMILAPLIAFYLLRDRRKIASLLMLMLPVRCRARAARAAREMRRETAGFLRGQLLTSAAVAALTALGLLLTGSPGWLPLGILMGVLELAPYAGPVAAGIPAVLLALQGGLWQAVWTLAVLLAVQQVEGSFLSPRLMAGATRLHPLLVLLAVSAGGIFAGMLGMILALPAVVCLRGAWRGLRSEYQPSGA